MNIPFSRIFDFNETEHFSEQRRFFDWLFEEESYGLTSSLEPYLNNFVGIFSFLTEIVFEFRNCKKKYILCFSFQLASINHFDWPIRKIAFAKKKKQSDKMTKKLQVIYLVSTLIDSSNFILKKKKIYELWFNTRSLMLKTNIIFKCLPFSVFRYMNFCDLFDDHVHV